jgi:phosphate transport system substrate-binding protein
MSASKTRDRFRPRIVAASVVFTGVALLAACGTPTETPSPVRLSLATDRSALPLARDLAAAYHAAQPHVSVDVEPVGNALTAEQAVRDGHADLALSTAPPASVVALRTQAIAEESVAVIVHPDNPLTALDLPEVQAIFHGDLRDWSQLEWEAGAIQVITREPRSGPRAALEAAVLNKQSLTPMAIVLPGDQEVIDRVAADRTSIGFVPVQWVDRRVKAIQVSGASPHLEERRTSSYPIMLPIHLLSPDRPPAETLALARFIRSRAGQRVIARRYTLLSGSP